MTEDRKTETSEKSRKGQKKISAAKKEGLRSLRYEFGLYPTTEQTAVLIDQAAMVRTLQNALICIGQQRYLRKIGDTQAIVPYLLCPNAMDDSDNHKLPSAQEMHRWITRLYKHDARWRALSTHTARRVVTAVDRSWAAFFRNLKLNPELAGKPKTRRARDPWIPHIHLKRQGEIGSAGSGCKLTHADGRNWQLELKGVPGVIHARGQLPGDGSLFFHDVKLGRFVDADVKQVAGKWKLSICTHVRRQRLHGQRPIKIEFDLIDGFVRTDGHPHLPDGIAQAQALQDDADRMQSERDLRWPKRAPDDPEWRDADAAIRRLHSRIARIRRNALHIWTTHIVGAASKLTIIAPKIRKHTNTPRGDTERWGAAVADVTKLNRHVLSQAPAMAIQMLKYKAEEAGIRCEIREDQNPAIAIGASIKKINRKLRSAARKLRRFKDAA